MVTVAAGVTAAAGEICSHGSCSLVQQCHGRRPLLPVSSASSVVILNIVCIDQVYSDSQVQSWIMSDFTRGSLLGTRQARFGQILQSKCSYIRSFIKS